MDFTVLMGDRRVIRAESEERAELEADGWRIIARSWGAGLKADAIDRVHLKALIDSHSADVVIRELTGDDVAAILRLDASTLGDYPGDIATAHQAFTAEQASPTAEHRGWGAFTNTGELVALTFTFPRPSMTETEFTVVHRRSRGQRPEHCGQSRVGPRVGSRRQRLFPHWWVRRQCRNHRRESHRGICARITSSLPLSKTSTTVSSSLP